MSRSKIVKSAPAFLLTCALGFGLTQAVNHSAPERKGCTFEEVRPNNTLIGPNRPEGKGFTLEEARSHLHKRVRFNLKCKTCPSFEYTTGRTMLVREDRDGQYQIVIDWDVSFRHKHEINFYDKENYQQLVAEVGPSED